MHWFVWTLYIDEIEPDLPAVQARIVEMTKCTDEEATEEAVIAWGERDEKIKVTRSDDPHIKAEFRLKEAPPFFFKFANFNDDDCYPPVMWEKFATWVEKRVQTMSPEERAFTSGRYGCARALQFLHLEFFEGYSLGQLCHIVNLAVQKKILGYLARKKWLVPYRDSDNAEKDDAAKKTLPSRTGVGDELACEGAPVATWEELREGLKGLGNLVLVAQIKRSYARKFSKLLSETTFGHTSLLNLLRDERLVDVCECRQRKFDWQHVMVLVGSDVNEEELIPVDRNPG